MRALRGAVSALCIAVAASLLLFGGSVRIASERTLDADRFAADAVGAMRTKTGLATTLRFIDDRVHSSLNANGIAYTDAIYEAEKRGLAIAFANPRVDAALRSSLVTVHRAVVAGDTPSRITLDVAPISGDLVAAIAVAEPTLGRVLAGRTLDVGSVTLANGTAVEPALRAVRSARRVRRLPPLAFGAAAVLFALALLVAERRRKAVGRVARALLGAAAGLFLLGYAVPYLVSRAAFEASAGAFAGEILAKLFSGWPVVVIPTAGLGIAMLLGLALTRTPGRS